MKNKLVRIFLLTSFSLSLVACGTKQTDTTVSENLIQEVEIESTEKVDIEEVKEIEEDKNYVTEKETLMIYLPENFERMETTGFTIYQEVGKNSSVNLVKTINDGSLDDVSGKEIVSAVETQLESIYGIDLTFDIVDEDFLEIDGHKAFKCSYTFDVEDIHILQTQLMIENGDEYECLTFADYNEGFLDIFTECMETLEYLNDSEIEVAIDLDEVEEDIEVLSEENS